MEGNIKIFFAVFTLLFSFYFTFADVDGSCDHSFGDSRWNYSHIYYNQTHTLKAGTQKLEINLPKKDGEMISFVCVRVPGLPANATHAAFASIFSKVTVTAAEPARQDEAVHVVAKKHGY